MSFEGLLTLLSIFIAIIALARPVQQKTIILFIPKPLIFLFITILILLFVFSEFSLFSKSFLNLCSFLFPAIALLVVYLIWSRARLRKSMDKRFMEFIKACIRDCEYSELVRIIKKNRYDLGKVLSPETIDLLFEKNFCDYLISIRCWLHLEILSKESNLLILQDKMKNIDVIARLLLNNEKSLLQQTIAKEYGGEEFINISEDEWTLINRTFLCPEWYIDNRFDYPLVISVYELIASGIFDLKYNQPNELYYASQGYSERNKCPIYKTIKIHVMVLNKAICNRNEGDFYVSDLLDIFRLVCDHNRIDKIIRNEQRPEDLSVFDYLLREINFDLSNLLRFKRTIHSVSEDFGDVCESVSSIWPFCIRYIYDSNGRVSDSFKNGIIKEYINAVLEMKESRGEWAAKMILDLKERFDERERAAAFYSVLESLDYGRSYVYKNHEWLRNELGLAVRGK